MIRMQTKMSSRWDGNWMMNSDGPTTSEAKVLEASRHLDGRRVLEVGAGLCSTLARSYHDAKIYVCADISPFALHTAEPVERKEVVPVACNGVRLPFKSRSFDDVLSFATVQYAAEEAVEMIREMLRVSGDMTEFSVPHVEYAARVLERMQHIEGGGTIFRYGEEDSACFTEDELSKILNGMGSTVEAMSVSMSNDANLSRRFQVGKPLKEIIYIRAKRID